MDSTIAILSEDQYDLVYNVLSFGVAVMLGAFVYFLTQMSSVNKEYRPAVAASAVVVGIAEVAGKLERTTCSLCG